MSPALIQNTYQRWKDKFESLSLRERMLFLISIVAVFYMAWDMVLMDRLHAKQKSGLVQLKKWQQQISDIDARIQQITAELSGTQPQETRQQIATLKTKIDDFNQREKNLVVGFIRPTQMVDVLKGLLADEKGLQLTSLQSLAAQPLIHKSQPLGGSPDPKALSDATRGKPARPEAKDQSKVRSKDKSKDHRPDGKDTDGAARVPEVYQHGLEVVFQGDYHSTLRYLRKLEQLPWKFYWDEVTYEVLQYPKAQISVHIHTLSLDKGWIGV